jgi:hypothetical protein
MTAFFAEFADISIIAKSAQTRCKYASEISLLHIHQQDAQLQVMWYFGTPIQRLRRKFR